MNHTDTMKLAIEALAVKFSEGWHEGIKIDASDIMLLNDAAQALAEQPTQQEPVKLWLWKNFVNGRPEYWAFNNPFPCITVNGDPLTFGEPCGWAFLKPSVNGRPERSEQEVINTVTRLAATSPPAQRTWVGLTDVEWMNIVNKDQAWFGQRPDEVAHEVAKLVEAKLKAKNFA